MTESILSFSRGRRLNSNNNNNNCNNNGSRKANKVKLIAHFVKSSINEIHY